MGILTRLFGRRKLPERRAQEAPPPRPVRVLAAREEVARAMRWRGLEGLDVLELFLSPNGEVRCILFRSKGFLSYCFERLVFLEGEEGARAGVPAVWQPFGGELPKPMYADLRDLKKELAYEPIFRSYIAP